MKTLLALLLVGIIVIVVVRGMRSERSAVFRRRFPGPDLPPRYEGTDTSFLSTGAFGSESSHHDHGQSHSADCAPSHDAGVSCGSDSGGGGGSSD